MERYVPSHGTSSSRRLLRAAWRGRGHRSVHNWPQQGPVGAPMPMCFAQSAGCGPWARAVTSPGAHARNREGSRLKAFGAGSRICLGRHLALMEICEMVATLASRFDMELTDPSREWSVVASWFFCANWDNLQSQTSWSNGPVKSSCSMNFGRTWAWY